MRRLLLLVAVGGLLALTSCFGPAPGHGAKAAVGFRAGNRVIVALSRFQGEHGFYPAKEEDLVPRYLPSLAAFSYACHGEEGHLVYRREKKGSFSLEFGYVAGFPSYMNSCYYRSETQQWRSIGYY